MTTTSRVVATEVGNLLDHLMDAEIAIFAKPVIEKDGIVSWPRERGRSLIQRGAPTVKTYRDWIESGAYSAVLYDGALLQLTYEFVGRNLLVRHRLAYVPFPFEVDRKLVRDFALMDLLDLCGESGADDVVLRSAIRFDFDQEAQKHGHPASHLTFNSQLCRIACAAPLRLGSFVRFVFQHFYPRVWSVDSYLASVSRKPFGERTITPDEMEDFHLGWRT